MQYISIKTTQNRNYSVHKCIDRLPFDWKNPRGYLIGFIFQYASSICAMLVIVSMMALIFGACWMLTALTQDIKVVLLEIEPEKNPKKLFDSLFECIELYTDLKQLSEILGRNISNFNIY